MGQAKQRGTFAKRVTMAQARNVQLMEVEPFQKLIKKHGVQRVATRLVASGQMKTPTA